MGPRIIFEEMEDNEDSAGQSFFNILGPIVNIDITPWVGFLILAVFVLVFLGLLIGLCFLACFGKSRRSNRQEIFKVLPPFSHPGATVVCHRSNTLKGTYRNVDRIRASSSHGTTPPQPAPRRINQLKRASANFDLSSQAALSKKMAPKRVGGRGVQFDLLDLPATTFARNKTNPSPCSSGHRSLSPADFRGQPQKTASNSTSGSCSENSVQSAREAVRASSVRSNLYETLADAKKKKRSSDRRASMYVGVPVLPERQLTADSGAISVSLRVLPHDERPIRPMEAPVYAKMYKSDSPIDENAVHIAQAQEDLYSSLDMLRPPPPAFASRKVERKSSSSEDGEEAEAEALYASMISPNVTDTKLTVGTEEREELCATLVLGQEDEDEGEEKDRDQVFV